MVGNRLLNVVQAAFKKHFGSRLVRIKLRPKVLDPTSPSLRFLIDPERIMLVKTSGTPLEIKYSLRTEIGFLNNKPMGAKEKKWFSDAFEKIMEMVKTNKAIIEVEDMPQ